MSARFAGQTLPGATQAANSTITHGFLTPLYSAAHIDMPRTRKHGAPDRRSLGVATVEFALAALLFFTVMLAIADIGIMYWVNLTMQHAVREGARYAITGRTDLDPDGENNRYRAVIQQIRNNSMGLYDSVSPTVNVYAVTAGGETDIGESFGGPGDLIVIELDCSWPLITPLIRPFFTDGKYNFIVRATMKNEPFGGG
jgi:Flp pilus assembly protein TadG